MKFITHFVFISAVILFAHLPAQAGCGTQTYTWTGGGGNTNWTRTSNWSPVGYPGQVANTSALINSASKVPAYPANNLSLACLEVSSGSLTLTPGSAETLTITGDYFMNLNVGSITTNSNLTINMNGTTPQSFENVDSIDNLTISNPSTVDLTQTFSITTALTINSTAGTIYIDGTVSVPNNFTIPANTTVEIRNGGTLVTYGNVTITGVLRVDGGGKFNPAGSSTVTVSTVGSLLLEGSSGNLAVMDSFGGIDYGLIVNGSLTANYFTIARCRNVTPGVDVFGTILGLSNGEFHYSVNESLTLENGATSIGTWSNVGFFDDKSTGIIAVNATNYDLESNPGIINVTNYSGVSATNDTKNVIRFGAAAPIALQVVNASINPPSSPVGANVNQVFGAFGFSLSNSGTSTAINSITVTLDGVNSASDVSNVSLYYNTTGDCYSGGMGGPSWSGTFSGNPATAIIPITPNTVVLSNNTKQCLQVYFTTSAGAINGDTIGAKIAASADVVNSQGYAYSISSSPPVSLGLATITGSSLNKWTGATSGAWATTSNWSNGVVPTSTTDCQVGAGTNIPLFSATTTINCQNALLVSGGSMNFGNKAVTFDVSSSISVASGYSLLNSGSSTLVFNGSSLESSDFNGGTWGGNVTINNAAGVTAHSNWTIGGNLTISAGTLTVASGQTLIIEGNSLTISGTGAGLTLMPGATLEFTNASSPVLTVGSGGTLTLVGTANQLAYVTSDSTSHPYTVNFTGTSNIAAQYYSFSNLGAAGVTLGASTTINTTNALSNGTFIYPVANNTTFLTLNQKVPGNVLTGMTFDSGGSTATGVLAVKATSSVPTPAATLQLSGYVGDLTGSSHSSNTGSNYTISWGTSSNQLEISQQVSTTPASVSRGATVTMGEWGIQELQASSTATNITSITVTMTGTDTGADVSSVQLYQDTACNGTVGTQLGSSQTFSGTPATAAFSGLSYTVPASGANVCIIAQYTIASTAAAGTIGASINAAGDVVNSQGYTFYSANAPPVTLGSPGGVTGTSTTWTGGALTTNWATSENWNAGVPTAATDCVINATSFSPTIASGTNALCNHLTIASGAALTSASGSTLTVSADITNNGTFNQNSTVTLYGNLFNNGTFNSQNTNALTFAESGTSTTQAIGGTSALTIGSLAFNKTLGGGIVQISNPSVTVTTLTMSGSMELDVLGAAVLILPNGVSIPANNNFQLEQNSILEMGSGKTITVAGGTFTVNGAQSLYPTQTYANSGVVTNTGGTGTWTLSATSGTVNLTGWIFDYVGTGGITLGNGTSSVTISNLGYGQFSHLPSTFTSTALTINTSGTVPTSVSNIGWNWTTATPGINSVNSTAVNPPPAPTSQGSGYILLKAETCSSTISISNWFGDWYQGVNQPPPNYVTSSSGSCVVSMTTALSPVSLTSFTATPYNGSAVLNWTTGLESQNLGFNVYRSLSPSDGFVQINSELIRNLVVASTIHGIYQFYDNGISNNITYYYEIEDIAVNGTRTLHGPLSVTPSATLSSAPPPNTAAIVQSNSDNPVPAPSPTNTFSPGIQQVSNGVSILAKSAHTFRLEINVPAFTTAAAEVAPYLRMSIPGYSLSTITGQPELPQQVVMVEIPAAQTAAYTIISQNQSSQSGIQIAPVDKWTASAGAMVPSWFLDSAFYAVDALLPANTVSLGTITQSQGKYYLPVIVQPISYDPVQHTIRATSQIVMDISLDGDASWHPVNPNPAGGVWGQEDGLKITVNQAGVYQLSFGDFVNAGVDGAFQGKDLTRFKLYSQNSEIPLNVTSSVNGGAFGAGDSFQFYAPFFDTGESHFNTLMLIADSPSSALGLRMSSLNSGPSGASLTSAPGYVKISRVEQNTLENLGSPYEEGVDHIFWAQIYASPTDQSQGTFATSIQLPELMQTGTVTLQAFMAGSYGYYTQETFHHLRIWVNSSTVPQGDVVFFGNSSYNAVVNIPANVFVPGSNLITFQSVGDMNGNDYDIQLLNWFSVDYTHNWTADNDLADVISSQPGVAYQVSGFSNNDVVAYDVTDYTATAMLSNLNILPDGSGGYSAGYSTTANNSQYGHHIYLTRTSAIPLPQSIELNAGSNLSSTAQGADVIYIGTSDLLDAVEPLANLRAQQGFRVQLVDVEDIYSEFGQGLRDAQVVKNFIQYAVANWTPPSPSYIVLVGDGTDDPRNDLNYGVSGTVPIYMMVGSAVDFASDNWFVSWDPNDNLPNLSIGRIPGNTPDKIDAYVTKVLNYESNSARPAGAAAGNITLVADIDQDGGENFVPRADALASQITSLNSSLAPTKLYRTLLTDPQLKQGINNAFNSGSIIIHYIGHGAENMWAGSTVFTNADADLLQNTRLPVVIAMDCLNAAFFYADPGFQTLSDRLLFNANGGAIAFWGSTSLTSPQMQAPYQTALYQIIASQPGGIRLGDAVRLAKIQGGWDPYKGEAVESWTLLGDPMLKMILPGVATAATSTVVFTPPSQGPQSGTSSDNSNQSSGGGSGGGGGFLGCGTVDWDKNDSNGRGGGGGLPPTGATAEMGILILMLYFSRRFVSLPQEKWMHF